MDGTARRGDGRATAVIFDIDGTIMRPGCGLQRLHMGTMADAIEREAGVAAAFEYVGGDLFVRGHNLSGFTDAGTIDLILDRGGVPAARRPGLRKRIVATMCRRMTGAAEGLDARGDVLPGVARLVADLRRHGVIIGLSTGNARAVAGCKMLAAGLGGLEAGGGFGDRHLLRADIARDAVTSVRGLARAGSLALSRADIVLIGDTPSDVLAARAAGVRSLAVSTGAASADRLRDAGPGGCVASLADVTVEDLFGTRVASPL
ncbi:HAD family hydrolase [Sphaerisporangium sp. B11E5]|uniref:HAD family hydrolase n=1 Tax=Sphaerisporangium sp. B11E5 TaxID=3153563 RepID=UPI00325F54B4